MPKVAKKQTAKPKPKPKLKLKKVRGGVIGNHLPNEPQMNQQFYNRIRQRFGYYPRSYFIDYLNQGEVNGDIVFRNQPPIRQIIENNIQRNLELIRGEQGRARQFIEPEPHWNEIED